MAGIVQASLILGGARSGKSRRAIALAESTGLALSFIATARPSDAEMAARIARHRAERSAAWRVTEAPLDLVGALAAARAPHGVVVVDCVTLWLANLMEIGEDTTRAVEALAEELVRARGPVIVVSNEVGFGLAPLTPLGRAFRDEQGFANQRLARACGHVEFVLAGLSLPLKPAAA